MSKITLIKKVCLLGDAAVGKTSLIKKFVHDIFDDTYVATIGTKVTKKELIVRKPDTNITYHLRLTIWDLLGQHTFTKVKATAYKDTAGALVVCDITRPETLSHTKNWVWTLSKEVGKVPLILLVNKSDLQDNVHISEKDIQDVARELDIPYCFTSAKTGENVDYAFRNIGEALIGERAKKLPPPPTKRVKERRIKPTLYAILDELIDDFCNTHGGQEAAMPIIRRKIDEIGMDFLNPNVDDMKKLLWSLTNLKEGYYSAEEAARIRAHYLEELNKL